MRKLIMTQALREVHAQEMRKNEKVFIIGEEMRGGTFGITQDLHLEFGEERVIDTPISEKAILGAAIGSASTGLIPVAELMFADFFTCCFDEILNQMAKIRYMFGGQCNLPITLRLPNGIIGSAAAQHSQSIEAFLTHIPGLKVIYGGTPELLPGLLVTAINDPDPVMFLEHKFIYREKVELPDGEIPPVPFGKAHIGRAGKDVTVVATGHCVKLALEVAKELKDSVDMEVIDPQSLFPLDLDTIYKSVEKTGKLLVVTEENLRGAWSGELVSTVSEKRFNALKAAPVRIGALNTPIAFSPVYEEFIIPRKKDIAEAARALADV